MPMKRSWRSLMTAAALLSATLSGCASNSRSSPPLIGTKPQATPLPVSVSQIDPQSSQSWLNEVEIFLKEVDSLLNSETQK